MESTKGRKHLCGNSVAVRTREKRLLKVAMEGGDIIGEAIKLGYSEKSADKQVGHILNRTRVQDTFQKLLDKEIPDEVLVKKYKKLLNAKRSENGKNVSDNPVQLKCADSVAKLKGKLINETPVADVKVIIANYVDGG